MNGFATGPFIAHEPLDPELHEEIITRLELRDELLERIAANEYCLLLGPRNSGRTTTLHLVRHALQEGDRVPVYVDPRVLDLTDEGGFLQSLAERIRGEMESRGHGERLRRPVSFGADPVSAFSQFLTDVARSGLRPVILFDAIEDVPPNLLIALLNIAHALFVTRKDEDRRHQSNLVFVFAGYISLRYLTTYSKPELSPFNICSDVVIRDLTQFEAMRFMEDMNRKHALRFRFDALQAVVDYAGGDLNALQRLGAATMAVAEGNEITREMVDEAVDVLLADVELGDDETLRDMALEIEDDAATFDLVIGMLRDESRSYDPDRFTNALFHEFCFTYPEMTGALRLVRRDGEPVEWSFRNRFTRQFLETYFTPARVVRAYTALGKFTSAIERCGPLLEEIREEFVRPSGGFDDQHLNDVIIAMTNRIYAARSHEVAFKLISMLLTEAFGCADITYYDFRWTTGSLQAVPFLQHVFENDGTELSVRDAADRERLEVRAYRSRMFAVAHRPDSGVRVAIPVENMPEEKAAEEGVPGAPVDGEVTAVISLTPRLISERGVQLTVPRIHIIQRALRWMNFALNRLERDTKDSIIESASHLAGPERQTADVFVAHKFTDELLANLREQLGRVNSAFSFLFANTLDNVGLLHLAIHGDMKRAQLGLYEMSHPNNNVYYELGFGIGINLPGVMFIRRQGTGRDELAPPLLAGILYLEYGNYTGLIEGVARRLEEVLRRYVLRRNEPYLHFVQCEIPRSSRQGPRYAVVLEHDYFGDSPDYRHHVAAGLTAHGLEPVFVLDEETDARHLVKGHAWGKRLLDLYVLIKHADLVVCRCEEVTDSAEAAQVFLALGIAHGLDRPCLLTRLEKDANGSELVVPDDLRGISRLNYQRLKDLEQQIGKARLNGNGRSPRKGPPWRRKKKEDAKTDEAENRQKEGAESKEKPDEEKKKDDTD